MDTPLFTRHGSPFDGTPVVEGKSLYTPAYNKRCGRCGGTGIYSQFHGTCYDCGGRGHLGATRDKLYTQAQLDKLDAAADARRIAKNQKDQAAWLATQAAFAEAHGELVASVPSEWLGPHLFASELADDAVTQRASLPREAFLVHDIISTGRRYGFLTPKQAQLVRDAVARAAERAAEKAKLVATSQHVGTVSQKVAAEVECVFHATLERAAFRGYGRTETVHICQFKDAVGNILVTKTPAFAAEKGERGVLAGTVKQHDVYRDVKQTVIIRPVFNPS